MSVELQPCPFCGGDAEWVDIHDDEYGNTGGSVIECMSCRASTPVEFGFKENLTSAWNTRATPDPLSDPRVKALVDHLEMWLELASHCAIEDGVCCCGDNMADHSHPMNCGHSPVDHGSYVAQRLVESTSAALRAIEEGR